jgi:hypothetical protein
MVNHQGCHGSPMVFSMGPSVQVVDCMLDTMRQVADQAKAAGRCVVWDFINMTSNTTRIGCEKIILYIYI